MKLLHYVQLYILWLKYCSVAQGKLERNLRHYVPRIWNGQTAKLGQFPYQVGLAKLVSFRRARYSIFCGGAIIGKSKVLTAAHCLVPDDTRTFCDKICCEPKPVVFEHSIDRLRIIAGTTRSSVIFHGERSNKYQWRKISSYTYPNEYDFPEQDICVIITNAPYEFNEYVSSLPYASRHIDYGARMCTAAGFGLLNKDMNAPVYTDKLMWEDFKLLAQADCRRKHGFNMKGFICTENDKKDVTPGDSGGPLVCKKTGDPRESDKGIIVGIVCGENEYGNFYTRVSSYTKFVESAANKIAWPQFCIFIGLTLFLLDP